MAARFSRNVFEALRRTHLFGPRARFREHVALNNSERGIRYVLDAVVEDAGAIFVVEVKMGSHLSVSTALQLQGMLSAARELWQKQRRERREVFGMLIVPSTSDVPDIFPVPHVAVLLFDDQQHRFTNEDEIRQWILV